MQVQSLIPRPCWRREKWPGYEASIASPLMPLQVKDLIACIHIKFPCASPVVFNFSSPSFSLSFTDSAQSLQKSGGLYLNFIRVGSAGEVVSRERHLLAGDITIVRVGTTQLSCQP